MRREFLLSNFQLSKSFLLAIFGVNEKNFFDSFRRLKKFTSRFLVGVYTYVSKRRLDRAGEEENFKCVADKFCS